MNEYRDMTNEELNHSFTIQNRACRQATGEYLAELKANLKAIKTEIHRRINTNTVRP